MKKTAKIIAILASLCLLAAIFVVVGVAAETPVEGTWVVGDKGYDDLDDALRAAGGTKTEKGSKTVKLNKDVTVEEIINTASNADYKDKGYYVLQYSGRIDLNGHTITSSYNNNNPVFYPWYAGMSFEIVGEGKFVGVNSVITTTKNSKFLIEGRGSGIEIIFNKNHSSSTYVFNVQTSDKVTVKGDIIITPYKDAAGYVFRIGDKTSTADVSFDTANTLTFDGARVTVNPPVSSTAAVSSSASIRLILAYDNSATVVKNHSYIDLKHGNFFAVDSSATTATRTEEFSYATFKLLSYSPNANTDYAPKIWVDIDDSVVHAYESNVKRIQNSGSSGALFTLAGSKTLVTVDNSELGGACRSMSATYGFKAYTDSSKSDEITKAEADAGAFNGKEPDPAWVFTANVPASKFIFNNVDYIGDTGALYGSPWMFCSGANIKWTGGYIENRGPAYKTVTTINVPTADDTVAEGEVDKVDTAAEVVDLESWKALCVNKGLDANTDYYYTKTAKNDGTTDFLIYIITSSTAYTTLAGDTVAYSEFTKQNDGSYAPTKKGEIADEWFGVLFENIYSAAVPAKSGYNAWPRIMGRTVSGTEYASFTVYKDNTHVVYPVAYLNGYHAPAYFNTYNPTTNESVSDAGFEKVPREFGTFTSVLSVNGSNGYLKFVTGNNKSTQASYLGVKTHKEYISPGTYEIGGGITLNKAGNTATKYKYIVQQFDLATESGTYAYGRFQFVVRSVKRASYSTTAATGAIQATVNPIEIKNDGTVLFDTSRAWAIHKNSGKTAKLSTEPLDWSRITVIYEIPGTYQKSTPATTYYAYVGDVHDLTLGEDGKYTDSKGVVYENVDNGSYYHPVTSDAIAKSEAGKEHLPAFISDTEGNIYTYTGSYTYTHTPAEGEAKTIKINANLTSETEYFVTYMMDTKGEIYTYTVNEGTGVYLDSDGEEADGALVSAKVVRANSTSTVYVRSFYRRAITRDTGILDVYAHFYIDGEWYITYTDFFSAIDVDALDSVLLDQLRYNFLNNAYHVEGSDILVDNAMVKYYTASDDYSAVEATVKNLDKPLSSDKAFTSIPDNNYFYRDVVGTVDGVVYKSEETLIGAIEEGSLVESNIDFSGVITPDKSFTVRFSEGKSAKGFISDEYAVFTSGNVVNVSPAYADEIYDVTLSSDALGIDAAIDKAAYGTLANIPEEYTDEGFADVLDGETVRDIDFWTTDESLATENLTITGDIALYAKLDEYALSEAAIVEWYDNGGELLLREYYRAGESTVATEKKAVKEALSRVELGNGWYDLALDSWDKSVETTILATAGETYEFNPEMKPIVPEKGVSDIKINLTVSLDFDLNVYIPAFNVPENVTRYVLATDSLASSILRYDYKIFKVYKDSSGNNVYNYGDKYYSAGYVPYTGDTSALTDAKTSTGLKDQNGDYVPADLTVGGKPYVKFVNNYGVADSSISTYYLVYVVDGETLVQEIKYGVPYYASAVMDESFNDEAAKKLVMNMVNYSLSIVDNSATADKTGDGVRIYRGLLEKYKDEYVSLHETSYFTTNVDVLNTINTVNTFNSREDSKINTYISSASMYFSDERPTFIFKYSAEALALGIKQPKSNDFIGWGGTDVYCYFGFGGESTRPAKQVAFDGGIANGTKLPYNSSVWGDNTKTDGSIEYYSFADSYRNAENASAGMQSVKNLLNVMTINVVDGTTTVAAGRYSFANYVNFVVTSYDAMEEGAEKDEYRKYVDISLALWAYAEATADYVG